MPKDRVKQKENKKRFLLEERLAGKNMFGVCDPVPRDAIDRIITPRKQSIGGFHE